MSASVNYSAPIIQQFASNANFQTYAPAAISAANDNGVDPTLFLSLIGSESSFNPAAYNASGAGGIAQLMPGTASDLGVSAFDPVGSLNASASYLSGLYNKYGNWQDAIAAYKGGVNSSVAQNEAGAVLQNASWTPSLNDLATGGLDMSNPLGDSSPIPNSTDPLNTAINQTAASSTQWFQSIINWMSNHALLLLFVAAGLMLIIFGSKSAFEAGTKS